MDAPVANMPATLAEFIAARGHGLIACKGGGAVLVGNEHGARTLRAGDGFVSTDQAQSNPQIVV